MFSELPPEWEGKLVEEMAFVRENGFYLFDPETLQSTPKSLSILLTADEEWRDTLGEFVKRAIPSDLKDKIYFQPPEGYHVSLQWSKEFPQEELRDLTAELEDYFRNIDKILITLYGLYPSDNNFQLVGGASEIIRNFRAELTTIYEKHGAKPKLARDNGMTWISAARILQPFSKSEIEQAIQETGKEIFTDVSFSTAVLTLNDAMFSSQNSEILARVKLK
ncbi:hypothetical protein A2701_00025 [Candidatus Amesbacteria bacterium RIFCSPHIGHO2_01_FULL_47_34]|nr:MAG: hypothetical protein UX86_C0025G0004 [Candidatus Amesbacteria bacterium GW2011_GWC1_47_15]KKU97354.1 MAG: hypothetical protein UY28_C0023G0003 [Candidatus Amesbacteria bacterium GW2011_GWB1_48_13]OGD00049.1 MAG: hypothetical protein A2701_00025 [Candidatus Amesbacteria bacterium RIFCSPHIGHO2_01_FULL_47_34]OGD01281.1 MAG: hypothetical protein A2972_03590 [Candidatus Amesbacteria bacterium RIFCSPLOWO2_01_FULL_47_33]